MLHEIQEVTKQEYEELFKWLFGNNVKIVEEQDITLAPFYNDINIYYTQEIKDLFSTQAMQREGKIMQLGSEIFTDSNSYHTRLEHSKGAYRNCIEFLAIQFRRDEWRKYIEENKLKGYLVEKMKFMCIHDIGHSMFSHSIESKIGDENCTHEDIGKRIVQENQEIKIALENIKANEQDSNLSGDGSLEFLCEGNIDFDRMDFLMRDRLYLGEKDKENLNLTLNTMCELKLLEGTYVYVYKPEALPYIKKFLQLRDNMYKYKYRSKESKITDQLSSILVQQIKDGRIKNTKELQQHLNNIIGIGLEKLNINDYLNTNDITFLNPLIRDIDELESNELLNCIIPNNEALLQIAISFLDPKNTEYTDYNDEEKEFIKNIRNLINKRKNNKRIRIDSIVLSVETTEDMREKIQKRIRDFIGIDKNISGIYSYKNKFKKYDKKQPIYIEDEKGEIYPLDKYPNLQMDLTDDYTYGVFAVLPELKEKGIDKEKIDKIKSVIKEFQEQEDIDNNDNLNHNRMNMFKVEHNGTNYVSKMRQFFGEEK